MTNKQARKRVSDFVLNLPDGFDTNFFVSLLSCSVLNRPSAVLSIYAEEEEYEALLLDRRRRRAIDDESGDECGPVNKQPFFLV
mmetsp:Transcript_2167/g.4998  ORF Transcript_2167/g.4998 Transcript_2167/m.4998 type:complete len:84 (-) Transcript_2167:3-254(-)